MGQSCGCSHAPGEVAEELKAEEEAVGSEPRKAEGEEEEAKQVKGDPPEEANEEELEPELEPEIEREVIRIRGTSGDIVLQLLREEAQGMKVEKLRLQVASAVNRKPTQVSIVALARKLEDGESLDKFVPNSLVAVPLELICVVQELPPYDPSKPAEEQLPALTHMIVSIDLDEQHQAAKAFKQMLSTENPRIDEVIEAGVVPHLLESAQKVERPDLQFEAMWALTNIASGTSHHAQSIIDADGIPIMVDLLSSTNADVREQAVWALANIAGDSPDKRDITLTGGFMEPLLRILQDPAESRGMQRNATWALSNLCRGKPPAAWDLVEPSLAVLNQLLQSEDESILADTCWAFSYVSDGPDTPNIQGVVDAGVCERLVQLLLHNETSVYKPALRAVGNIVTGNAAQTDHVIQCGALPILRDMLSYPRRDIRKESCWSISNVLAGTPEQIQQVLDHDMVHPLVELIGNPDPDLQKEALWCVSNVVEGGTNEQIAAFVEGGVIPPMVAVAQGLDRRLFTMSLKTLKKLFQVGETVQNQLGAGENPFIEEFRAAVDGDEQALLDRVWASEDE